MASTQFVAAAAAFGLCFGLAIPPIAAFAQTKTHGHASHSTAKSQNKHVVATIVRSANIEIKYPPSLAIQLFTAEGEKQWVGDLGWDPTYVRGNGFNRGDVFAVGPYTFVVIAYDQAQGLAEYVRLNPQQSMTVIRIEALASGGGTTATVTFEMVGLSAEGTLHLKDVTDKFDQEMAEWEQRIVKFDDDIHNWLASRN